MAEIGQPLRKIKSVPERKTAPAPEPKREKPKPEKVPA